MKRLPLGVPENEERIFGVCRGEAVTACSTDVTDEVSLTFINCNMTPFGTGYTSSVKIKDFATCPSQGKAARSNVPTIRLKKRSFIQLKFCKNPRHVRGFLLL